MRRSTDSTRTSPGRPGSRVSYKADNGTVTVKDHRFLAEVAATRAAREKGLMHRCSLAEDRCMFFIHDEDGAHGIWMKNCLIPLDVVWITAEGRVVAIAEAVPPCPPLGGGDYPIYGGAVPARHFIEFAAGTIKRIGLKKGDGICWQLKLEDGTPVVGGASAASEKASAKTKRKSK